MPLALPEVADEFLAGLHFYRKERFRALGFKGSGPRDDAARKYTAPGLYQFSPGC